MIATCLLVARYFTFLFAPAPPVVPWNPLAAESEAIGVLLQRSQQPNNPFCRTPSCPVQHEILGEYELPYKTQKAHLLIAASKDPQHKCAACGVTLSFMEFTVSRQLWRVTHADFAIAEWGQNGEPFDGGITVDEAGSDAPRILVERRSTEKNGSLRTIDIYTRGAAGFHLVNSNAAGMAIPATASAIVRWDSVGARRQVLKALEAQGKKPSDPVCEIVASGFPGTAPDPGYRCTFEHQVLAEYDLPDKSGRRKLVIAGSGDPIHNCDGCGVALSFFEFEQGPGGWKLTHPDFGAGEWGQDGKPNLEPLTVGTLGDDIPCVYAQSSQMHQGVREVSTDIYARLEAGFVNAGSIDASYSDISVDSRPARVRDLLVKRLRRVDRYRFDGREYKLVPAADGPKKRLGR